MASNVDQSEIDKFSAHANDWWNENGSMKALHRINPLRMEYILNHAEITNKNVLDVGCGGGILSESLCKNGAKVTGIDLADDSIKIAKEHAKANQMNIKYLTTSIEELVEQNHKPFDVITCLEMLEHVPDPIAIVKSCSALLKPGGKIFFSTLNRNLKSYMLAVVGAEYVLNLLPRGTHDYDKFIKPSELEKWCREQKLQIKNFTGISYNPLSDKFSLTDDISVNYLAYFEKAD